MSMTKLLQEAGKFEIQAYQEPRAQPKDLKRTHVAFSGSPLRHPYDAKKLMLLADPFSTAPSYFEFQTEDISFVEKLANVTTVDGETTTMIRVWVRKSAVGVRCTPFVVEDAMG